MKTAILGLGEIGSALSAVLKKNPAVQVSVWDRNPIKSGISGSLPAVLERAEFLFLCVPSWAVAELAVKIRPHLGLKTKIVCLAKGMNFAGQTMPEILIEVFPQNHSALFYGPMIAEELKIGRPGVGVVAASMPQDFSGMSGVFANTNLKIEYADDLRGVALLGPLKNVYAIGLGVFDGLAAGINLKGFLIAKIIKELMDLVEFLGGKRETALGAAGLGDLVATGFCPHSRNRKSGDELARNGLRTAKSEGFVSLPAILKLVAKKTGAFPILLSLERVVAGESKPEAFLESFLRS